MNRRRFLQFVTRLAAPLAALIIAGCATQPAPPPAERPLKIGLALGGGAARGFAHIGVIAALEAQGIRPDIIVGTSAGSVVGTLYASGLRAGDLRRLSQQMDSDAITDWALPFGSHYGGVLKGEALQDWVNRVIGQRRIDQMPIRLGIVATDLQNGAPILFQSGNAGQAVRASSSVPGVFQPVRIGGRDYVDGGLVAPVPVSLARQMGADFVIAVNISAEPAAQDASGALGVLLQTTAIMGQTINHYELRQADVVVRPDLPTMKGTDFAARNAAIAAGEQAIAKILPQLRQKLAAAREQRGQ